MHYLAFNKEWFEKHQRFLIFLLNAPLIKRWFRWIMRIKKQDCPLNKRINRIMPNHYVMGAYRNGDEIILTTDFRTHWKYAKRLYYAFKPMWWAMHYWDWLIAERFLPRLSFGLPTLTVYPDPDPETTTVDGTVTRSAVDETFSTIRGGAGTSSVDTGTSGAIVIEGSTTTDQYDQLNRIICLFNTSAIGDADTIDSATFSLVGEGKNNGLSGETSANSATVLVASTPTSNTALVAADYSQTGGTDFGRSGNQSTIATDGSYTNITINATGRGDISKTGVTKYAVRYGWDLDNTTTGTTWASGGLQRIIYSLADTTGTSSDPKLVVTYSIPVTTGGVSMSLLLGVG